MGNRAGRSLNRRNPSSIAKPDPRLVAHGAVECDARVLVASGGRKRNRLHPSARQPQVLVFSVNAEAPRFLAG